MNRKPSNKFPFLFYFLSVLAFAASADTADDEHIRQIVAGLLKEKDQKIEQLEARIQQLEQERRAVPAIAAVPGKHAEATVAQPKPPGDIAKTAASSGDDASVTSKLRSLGKQVDELKAAAQEHGLEISGFFDINAKTGNSTDQTFSVGSVELDLDYAHDEHFGAGAALVLCGNSSNADYAAPAAITCGGSGPGGLSGGGTSAGIAVAVVDYHLFNDRIPPRGRVFTKQGLHIQAGRFDLPFGSDYQNFANKDRITVTAPLTTARMQLGGYNGDGVRTYGAWNVLNYSAFWTDALYADDGHAVGGRLGLALGQNTYTIRHGNQDGIELGVSHLSELDGDNRLRNTVYGADLSIGYGMLRWQNEWMLLHAHRKAFLDAGGNIVPGLTGTPFGKSHQQGYHSTLIADLERLTQHPVQIFARYGRWQPSQSRGLDYDGSTVVIGDISMLSLGFNYKFSEHLRLKFEYNDALGSSTAERYFDQKVGIAQMVMSF
ncbi:MAG: hypothetical protein EPN21_13995 [Methylococcaceae bacterium]|nr:MAG: hypothetical protein EPN21_13995 [Methylococcaceae bacterium]